ncbi:MAG: 4'-phosphopantetheinyl transferase superfamily protein [Parcubacteria group bacterium]|nr:4'-phosphopantetheinyl transferase superfamily protein [Parcubacteria group bacterium]
MIGIDIIAVRRFIKLAQGDFPHWKKFFTHEEWEYAFNRPNPSASLAGLYAAKEALMKAAGGDLVGRFDRISVAHQKDGTPRACIDGETSKHFYISISHTDETAVAVAARYA